MNPQGGVLPVLLVDDKDKVVIISSVNLQENGGLFFCYLISRIVQGH